MNNVKNLKVNGRSIEPGDILFKGSDPFVILDITLTSNELVPQPGDINLHMKKLGKRHYVNEPADKLGNSYLDCVDFFGKFDAKSLERYVNRLRADRDELYEAIDFIEDTLIKHGFEPV